MRIYVLTDRQTETGQGWQAEKVYHSSRISTSVQQALKHVGTWRNTWTDTQI
jgi:hypothetical protein